MRLAGKEQQHGALGIIQQSRKPRAIAQQQRGALVGREAAREADRQHIGAVRVEETHDLTPLRAAHALPGELQLEARAHAVEHARFHILQCRPEILVGRMFERRPERRVRLAIHPVRRQVAIEKIRPSLVQEGGQVHAVRDEADRVLLRRELRPVRRAKPRRNTAVYAAHAIGGTRAGKCEPGHVELVRHTRGASEFEHALERPPEPVEPGPELLHDEVVREAVVSGRDGCVRREHALRRDRLERDLRARALRDAFAHALEDQERRVALVDVPHGGCKAERAQRAHAADAEHHLLTDACRLVAAVEAMGDLPVLGRVVLAIGIQQEHAHAADLRAPDARTHCPARDLKRHGQPLAVGAAHRLHGQIARIVTLVDRVLRAVAVDGLREIALPVQEANGHEVEPLVARRLAVIAGEYPEASRVDRKAFVKTVLGAEIRHEGRIGQCGRSGEVGIEIDEDLAIAGEIDRIRRGTIERCLVYTSEQQLRIAVRLAPEFLVEVLEERSTGPQPAEEQVSGKFRQTPQVFGNIGAYFDEDRRSHGVHRIRLLGAPAAPAEFSSFCFYT